MRDLKFRAFDNKSKKMRYEIFDVKIGNDEDYNVMQYTGLKDKNGKEIYESDKLLCDDGKIREIVWYELGAGWRLGTDDNDTYFNGLGVYANELEVIGNIYENPELINK